MFALRPARAALLAGLVTALALAVVGCSPATDPTSSSSAEQPGSASPTPTATPTVTASITIAGVDVDGQHVSVAGFVAGLVEDKGACTYTFSDDATKATIKLTSTGAANVSTTTCGTQQEPIASFTRGAWHVRLSYKSLLADVTSPSIEMQVP